MNEDFLHYVWKHQLFSKIKLQTSELNNVEIIFAGLHNINSGPDFLNAKLKIDAVLWAGHVESHVKSSDW